MALTVGKLTAITFVFLLTVGENHGNLLRKQNTFEQTDPEVLTEFWKNIESNVKGASDTIFRAVITRIIRAAAEMELSDECYNSLNKLIFGMRNLKLWAIQFLDSAGKPAPGYMIGTVSSFGSYDECVDIKVPGLDPTQVDFQGQYCLLDLRFPLPPKPRYYTLVDPVPGMPNITLETEVMKKLLQNVFINYFLSYRFAICVPSTCSIEDVKTAAKYVADFIGVKSDVPMCETKETFNPDTVQVTILIVIIAFLSIIIIFTLVDISPNFWSFGGSEKSFTNLSFPYQIARACSLNANTIRLVDTNSPEPRTDCLNGIKFFSIAWVILGHTYLLINWQMIRSNEISKAEIMKPAFQVVMSALVSVDTFFTITSFLLASISIQLVDKAGKSSFNIPLFFLSRLSRLLPVMVLTTGLVIVLPLFGDGPIWHETLDVVAQNCRANWWYNFIFIGNFLEPREVCLPHFWYAITDMQLIPVSLIFLLLIFRNSSLGVTFALFTVGVSCSVTAVITYVKDLQPTILLITPDPEVVINAWKNCHFMPYVHVAPYSVGLIFGYLFARHANIKINHIVQCIFWVLSFASGLLIVYGTAWWNAGKPWEVGETLLFSGLHRTVWATAVGWMIFSCCTGRGGVINRILSWKGFVPASRLTYSAYLIHCLIIWYGYGLLRGTKEGQTEATWHFLGNLSVTFGLAFFCYVFVEAPINQVVKVLILRLYAKPKKYLDDSNGVDEKQISTINQCQKSNSENKVQFQTKL